MEGKDEDEFTDDADDVVPPSKLSALTPFVGRNVEVEHARRALSDGRLVNLHGPIGAGKTATANRLLGMVDGGRDAVVVQVGPMRSRDELESALVSALGLGDNVPGDRMARLAAHVRDRRVLIVLDGCERLLTGAAPLTDVVRTLLAHGPDVTILVTSQIVLGIGIEHVVPVGPMSDEDAVLLLTVQAASHGVSIPESARDDAGRVCALVGNLPVGINMAASWLRVQSVSETLAGALKDPDVVLDALQEAEEPHHRRMRYMMDRTAGLLTENQRRMWAVVSMFGDGVSQEAITAACALTEVAQGPHVVRLLRRLIDAALVTRTEVDGVSRYGMYALARMYGQRMRLDGLDPEAIRAAHALHYAGACERAATGWLSDRELIKLRSVLSQRANLDAAVDYWFEHGNPLRGLGMIVNVARTRAHTYAARLNVLRESLIDGLARHPAEPSDVQVTALGILAWLWLVQGNPEAGRPVLARAHEAAGQLGDVTPPVLLYMDGVYAALAAPDPDTARSSIALLDTAAQAVQAPTDRHMVELFATLAEVLHGDPRRAVERSAGPLAVAEAAGAPWATAWAQWVRAVALVNAGDHTEAAHHLRLGLAGQRDCGDTGGVSGSLWLAAVIAASTGEERAAAHLFGAAAERRRLTGVAVHTAGPLLKLHVVAAGTCRRKLGAATYERATTAGAAMPLPEAVELALSTLDEPRRTRLRAGSPAATLTRRELDVVALVADGLTNKEIGARLHLSDRTVETYIARAARKTGVCGRVELTAWYLGGADTVA